jgi:tetratricopeptide (TPR) repeat protein
MTADGRYNRALNTQQHVEVLTPKDRLESWKEIAAFLNRSERTVRRWEEKEGLPVHRLAHDKRGSVYAYTWELERWRESRRQLVDAEPADVAPARASHVAGMLRRVVLGVVVAVVTAASVWMLTRPGRPMPRQRNPEAVRLAQLANFGVNAGRVQVETGIKYYQDAIRLDPEYAPAWIGLAAAHFVQIWFAEVPALEASTRARRDIQRAMEINPRLGQSWRVLAGISHYVDWDHRTAEAQIRKAQELAPHDPAAFSWLGDFLVDMRRFDEARTFYKRAQEVSPRWLEPITFLGNVHYFTGHPDLAIVEYQRVLESEPSYGLANHFLGRAYLAMGQHEKALLQLRKSNELLGQVPMSEADLGYALAVGDQRAGAEAVLGRMLKRRADGYYPAFAISEIHLGLGNTDAALEWLERAADDRHMGFYLPSVDPLYDSVRSHPRFRKLLQRINLDQTP